MAQFSACPCTLSSAPAGAGPHRSLALLSESPAAELQRESLV